MATTQTNNNVSWGSAIPGILRGTVKIAAVVGISLGIAWGAGVGFEELAKWATDADTVREIPDNAKIWTTVGTIGTTITSSLSGLTGAAAEFFMWPIDQISGLFSDAPNTISGEAPTPTEFTPNQEYVDGVGAEQVTENVQEAGKRLHETAAEITGEEGAFTELASQVEAAGESLETLQGQIAFFEAAESAGHISHAQLLEVKAALATLQEVHSGAAGAVAEGSTDNLRAALDVFAAEGYQGATDGTVTNSLSTNAITLAQEANKLDAIRGEGAVSAMETIQRAFERIPSDYTYTSAGETHTFAEVSDTLNNVSKHFGDIASGDNISEIKDFADASMAEANAAYGANHLSSETMNTAAIVGAAGGTGALVVDAAAKSEGRRECMNKVAQGPRSAAVLAERQRAAQQAALQQQGSRA